MDIDLWFNNTIISKLNILSTFDMETLRLISVSDFEKIVSNVGLDICRLFRMYEYNDFCLVIWYFHIITQPNNNFHPLSWYSAANIVIFWWLKGPIK